jgi:hypothetical protein
MRAPEGRDFAARRQDSRIYRRCDLGVGAISQNGDVTILYEDRRRNMRSRKLRTAVALALITLFIVVFFSLVMGRQFHQRSWIAKAVHGAADAAHQLP